MEDEEEAQWCVFQWSGMGNWKLIPSFEEDGHILGNVISYSLFINMLLYMCVECATKCIIVCLAAPILK